MRARFVLVLVGMLGCTKSGPGAADEGQPIAPTQPQVEPAVEPDVEPVTAAISVEMTAATLADDCGGGPNTAPLVPAKAAKHKSDEGPPDPGAKAKAKRRCEQSSIQLAIVAPAGAEPAALAVRSVELFGESGALVGKLEARAPSVWSEADGYTPWDQGIEPGEDLSVSYALTQPDWSTVDDRWNQTFTVKAVVSIAGDDRTVQQTVAVAAPTSLPPGVKT